MTARARGCVPEVREIRALPIWVFFALLSLGGIPATASAQTDDALGTPETPVEDPVALRRGHTLRDARRLLDDPGGVRSRLGELGVDLQLFYNQVIGWKASGGVEPNNQFGHSGSYDLFGLADFEELLGWPGLQMLVHVKGQYDRNINDDVGALADPVDDADFDEPIYVDELWLQQGLFRDRLRLRIGFQEQQTVFDRNAYANNEDRQFLSSFLDNNPLVPLPNGLAVVLLARPARWLELAAGIADADNVSRRAGFDTFFDSGDSLNGYFELAFHAQLPGARGDLPGTYRLGVFLDGSRRSVFHKTGIAADSPETSRGHVGMYASFDQQVLRESGRGDQGLGLFWRFGYADEDVNPVAWFWSLGLQYTGLVPGRDRDVLGLGVYQAIRSKRYRDTVDPDFDRETGIEFYYRSALLPWFAVTPDLQYIVDPGANGAAEDAVTVMMRFRVTF